ncbi:MAG TPA: hypothetical protein PLX39_17285 [Pyrinomonadaceae bacterium]|nr:hypothetical protein [Pyrinomonadaceae bacterium]
MAQTKKIKVLISRGNPSGGPIIRSGSTIEIAAFWADRWIADGTAELVAGKSEPEAKPQQKKHGKR